MSQDVHDWDGEPSLTWYGHPPRHAPVAEAETDVAAVSQPDQELDVYGRLVMSALVVGDALLLARSRAFGAVTSIAFFALLSFFPFLLLALSVLGMATADEADRAAVLGFVLRYLLRQFEFITGQIDALRQSTLGLGVAGSLLMVWAALGVFGAITTAVNYAWGVETTPDYFQHKLVSFLMVAAAGFMLLTALMCPVVPRFLPAGLCARPGLPETDVGERNHGSQGTLGSCLHRQSLRRGELVSA